MCALPESDRIRSERSKDVAISIPSDLVLDVVRAADPAAAGKAQALLESAASRRADFAARTPEFTREVASAAESGLTDLRTRLSTIATKPGDAEIPEVYRKFESMVLGNFVQSMMPEGGEEVFGKGTAGEIWKGMMAQEIGDVIAEGGGIGIAARMAAEDRERMPAGDFAENTVNRAASMVNSVQMSILGDIVGIDRRDGETGDAVI